MVVTDVTDANSMYVQMADEPRVTWLAEQLAELDVGSTPAPQARPVGGGTWGGALGGWVGGHAAPTRDSGLNPPPPPLCRHA